MNSFGLQKSDPSTLVSFREKNIMEPFFALFYYGGMSWPDYYNFPVTYTRWLIKRIDTEISKAVEKGNDIPDKSLTHNGPDIRQLTGKFKPFQTNGKTSRFT